MDYTIAAAKLMGRQLKTAEPTTSDSTQSKVYIYAGILFQRVWLQGVIVKSYSDDDPRVLLDDGSALIQLSILDDRKLHVELGKYVMVVGSYYSIDDEPVIKVHKLVDLSAHPDREAMWYLEVIEACKMFYQPLPDEAKTPTYNCNA